MRAFLLLALPLLAMAKVGQQFTKVVFIDAIDEDDINQYGLTADIQMIVDEDGAHCISVQAQSKCPNCLCGMYGMYGRRERVEFPCDRIDEFLNRELMSEQFCLGILNFTDVIFTSELVSTLSRIRRQRIHTNSLVFNRVDFSQLSYAEFRLLFASVFHTIEMGRDEAISMVECVFPHLFSMDSLLRMPAYQSAQQVVFANRRTDLLNSPSSQNIIAGYALIQYLKDNDDPEAKTAILTDKYLRGGSLKFLELIKTEFLAGNMSSAWIKILCFSHECAYIAEQYYRIDDRDEMFILEGQRMRHYESNGDKVLNKIGCCRTYETAGELYANLVYRPIDVVISVANKMKLVKMKKDEL